MRKVLILSTDKQLLQYLPDLLADQKLNLSVLQTPDEWTNAVRSVRPDVLVVDFYMDGICGGAICHQLKSDDHTRNLPVIMLSDDLNIAPYANKFGCDALLSKVSQLRQLADTINLLLEKRVLANVS